MSDAYGLGTLSRGGSFESAPRFGLGGFGVAGAFVAAAFSAWSCCTCASSVCTLALILSRSSRVSLRAGRVSVFVPNHRVRRRRRERGCWRVALALSPRRRRRRRCDGETQSTRRPLDGVPHDSASTVRRKPDADKHIFSFMATSYFFCRSFRVGSYDK